MPGKFMSIYASRTIKLEYNFREMKKEEESGSKLEVAGELPGWGSWGGSGIKPRERKTRRKGMINVPPLPKRKDHDKEDMIIREMSNAKAVEHMVIVTNAVFLGSLLNQLSLIPL